jgi:hypothetical protein
VVPCRCCTCGITCLMVPVTSRCIRAMTSETFLHYVKYGTFFLSLVVDVRALCDLCGKFIRWAVLVSGVMVSVICAVL